MSIKILLDRERKKQYHTMVMWAHSSVGEHCVRNAGVGGSNPPGSILSSNTQSLSKQRGLSPSGEPPSSPLTNPLLLNNLTENP